MLNAFADTHPLHKVLNVECLCRHTPIAQVLNVECLCRHTHSTSFYCWQEKQQLTSHMKSNVSTRERVGEARVAIICSYVNGSRAATAAARGGSSFDDLGGCCETTCW